MNHLASIVMWLAIAAMVIAFWYFASAQADKNNAFKLACFQAGGTISWTGNCEK